MYIELIQVNQTITDKKQTSVAVIIMLKSEILVFCPHKVKSLILILFAKIYSDQFIRSDIIELQISNQTFVRTTKNKYQSLLVLDRHRIDLENY